MNYVYQGSPNESSEVQRSGLHQLLGELQAGDCLAVTSLSGVADSSAALLELLDDLKQRGIRFRSVQEGLDTGTPEGQTAVALLRAALGSVADRAIIPMYDWLGLGAEAHLNTPGKLGGNWAWRAKAGFDSKALAAQIEAECAVYCRCNADTQNVKESAI